MLDISSEATDVLSSELIRFTGALLARHLALQMQLIERWKLLASSGLLWEGRDPIICSGWHSAIQFEACCASSLDIVRRLHLRRQAPTSPFSGCVAL